MLIALNNPASRKGKKEKILEIDSSIVIFFIKKPSKKSTKVKQDLVSLC